MSPVTLTHVRINRRHVEPGTELSIRGERGRFRFIEYRRAVVDGKPSDWITVYGGPANKPACRSFSPTRVTTVHRTTKVRP